jgi:hypothetical protein
VRLIILPACEIRAVVHFLQTKKISAAQILRELCAPFYGQNVISEWTMRDGVECESFFTMKTEMACPISVVSDDFVESVEQKICDRRCSTNYSFRVYFHKCHILLSTILAQLG